MEIYTIKRMLNNEENIRIVKEVLKETEKIIKSKNYNEIHNLLNKFGRDNYDLVFYGVIEYFYDEYSGFSEINKEFLLKIVSLLKGNKSELDTRVNTFISEYY